MATNKKALFNPARLAALTEAYKPRVKQPGFPPAALLGPEYEKYKAFLGTSDYAAQGKEATALAKLRIALAMAQRGFASMGAAPQRGESPIGTIGRTLLSPIAADIAPIAGRLMEQRQAAKAAQEQEDRQLKLAALTGVQRRQEATYATDIAAGEKARALMLAEKKKGGKIRTDLTVGGKNIPVIIRTNAYGNIEIERSDGTKVPVGDLGVYRDIPKDWKPSIVKIEKIQKKIGKNWVGVPVTAVTSIGRKGKLESQLFETGTEPQVPVKIDNTSYRREPPSGKTGSSYIAPAKTVIYIKDGLVRAFSSVGLTDAQIGSKATLLTHIPKPDVGKGLEPIIQIQTPGKVFKLSQHTGYDPVTGNITLDDGTVVLADDLWTTTDKPKANWVPGSSLTIDLDAAATINEAYSEYDAKQGEEVQVLYDKNNPEVRRYFFRDKELSKEVVPKLLARPLSEPEKRAAGLKDPLTANWTKGKSLTVTLEAVATINDAHPNLKAKQGEEVQVLYDNNNPENRRYWLRDQELDKSTALKLIAGPLSKAAKRAAGLEDPLTANWTKGTSLTVNEAALKELNKKYPNLHARVGDTVTTYFDKTNIDAPWRLWLKGKELKGMESFLQAQSLSQRQKEAAGQVVVERKIYTNYSTTSQVLNVGGEKVTLDPGGFYPLSESERNAQSPAVKAALRVVAPVSAEPVTYTFKEKRIVGDKEYLPGHTITVTPSVYREFEERIQQALTTDPADLAVVRKKKHITSLVDLIRVQEPRLVNATFGTREMEAVLAQFPGAARGASAAEKLYDIIVSIMKYSNTSQGQASNAAISADKDKETTYSESVEQELNWAKKAYKGYQVKGALPPTPFDQLPFMDQMAFARLSQSGLNLRNVDAKWQAAKTALGVTRAKYKAPTSGDVAMFANKVRLRTILQDMLENYDLSHTGVLMGPLQKIRGAFSGWPVIGSIEAGKFASTLSQLSANMRSLQAGEGKDARPSNYRIGLITDLLPKWGRAEDINTRNVKQAIAVLDTNIRSYFADAVASEAIVPQSFSRMAAEAGLKGLGVHQGKYWWLDPKVGEAEQLPFTMEAYRRSIGEVPWSQSSFNEMKPGVMLPRSALPAGKTGGVQTYWIKARDRKGQGMIIETDRFSRPLKGAKPVPFVMRQKEEK